MNDLILEMRDALKRWEECAWDGDPIRRDDDEMCKKARSLVKRADEIISQKGYAYSDTEILVES